jgi:chromosomal replication initiator protein
MRYSFDVLKAINPQPTLTLKECAFLALDINSTKIKVNPYIHNINKTICFHFNLELNEFLQKDKKRKYVKPRQIATYFSKKLTTLPISEIGRQIGGKSHANVLYSIKVVNNAIETNKAYALEIKEIENKLKQS